MYDRTISEVNTQLTKFQTDFALKKQTLSDNYNNSLKQDFTEEEKSQLLLLHQTTALLVENQVKRSCAEIEKYLAANPKLSAQQLGEIAHYLDKTSALIDHLFLFQIPSQSQWKQGFFQKSTPLAYYNESQLNTYRYQFSNRSKKEGWFLGGSALLGGTLGAALGFFVGLCVGAIIAGGLGSVVPIFGNLVSVILGGISGAAGMAVKGALIGSSAVMIVGAFVTPLVVSHLQTRLDIVKSNASDMANVLTTLINTDVTDLKALIDKENSPERNAQFKQIQEDLLAANSPPANNNTNNNPFTPFLNNDPRNNQLGSTQISAQHTQTPTPTQNSQ